MNGPGKRGGAASYWLSYVSSREVCILKVSICFVIVFWGRSIGKFGKRIWPSDACREKVEWRVGSGFSPEKR